MTTIWDYESSISRRARRPSGKGWTRVCVFENIPSTSAETLIPAEFTEFPGETGKYASVLMDSDLTLEWKPAPAGQSHKWLSRAVLYYRPRSFSEWLESNPNKGVLMMQCTASGYKAHNTSDGDVIEGLDFTDADGKTRWTIKQGNNNVFRYRAMYEVYSVVSTDTLPSGYSGLDVYFSQFVTKVGRYNQNYMTCFNTWPEPSRVGQWMLTSISCVPRAASRKLYTVRHGFAYNNETSAGWGDPVISQKWQMQTRTIDDGEGSGTKTVAVWVPASGTGSTSTNHLLQGADFSPIADLLASSW
jgi:hypothetical protein